MEDSQHCQLAVLAGTFPALILVFTLFCNTHTLTTTRSLQQEYFAIGIDPKMDELGTATFNTRLLGPISPT